MSENNNLLYTPVTLTPEDSRLFYRGKQLSWWSENSLLPYNAMLISAYHGMDTIKNRSEIRDNVLVLGDSGGYQILQNNLGKLHDPYINEKLTWQKVIEWQMKVCNIGITLDVPPPRTKDKIYTPEEFNEYLEISKENAISMYNYKNIHYNEATIKDFKLFNCIHGADYNEMELWYKETTDNHNIEYDGFALSGNGAKHLLPLRLGFAIEHSVGKPYHILGISSPQLLFLIAYANKYTKTNVYFDSSSAALGKINHKYLIDSYFPISVSTAEAIKKGNAEPITCDCPICEQLERPSDLWSNGTTSGTLITLHNLYLMSKYIRNVNGLHEKFFHSFVHKSSRMEWLFQCMEYLDAVHEMGFEAAWNLYGDELKKGDRKKITSGTYLD